MAKAILPKLDWNEVNPATLSAEAQGLLQASKDAYKVAKAAREAFEEHMQQHAPTGKRLVFGYNFGKLSVAIADAKADTPKASRGALDFSTLIARR